MLLQVKKQYIEHSNRSVGLLTDPNINK